MVLHIIGLGLCDENDITLRGLAYVRESEIVYLESYTSKLAVSKSKERMEQLYQKPILLADRIVTEGDQNPILEHAKTKGVSFLVIGDPFSATTHLDLYLRAKKEGIEVTVTYNASVLTAVGIVGLQLYKYGKTTSIPFPQPGFKPQTAYDVIAENRSHGLHTLCLLDIHADIEKYMTVPEAIRILLDIESVRNEKAFTEHTLCVGCARLGCSDVVIKGGTAKELLSFDFGKPLHCLVVPGTMHFMEEEALALWK